MNKPCLFIMLGLASCLNSHAQLARYSLDFTMSKENFVDSIEIDYDQQQVYVPVEIEGRRLRFLLDTGSGQTVVFADTPVKGCRNAGKIISYDAINQRDTVKMVILPPMRLGMVTFTGCQAILHQRAVKGRKFDGILGFDIINKGLSVKIDPHNRLLVLTDRKNYFDREQGYETRYRLHFHVPHIEVSPFGKYVEDALFDTGSRQLYSMNKKSFDRGALKNGKAKVRPYVEEGRAMGRHAIGHYGTEPRSEVVFLNLSQLMLGDFSFCNVHTITTHGGSHVGAKVFDYGAIMINPLRKRMRFQPYANGGETTANGMGPIVDGGKVKVGGQQTEIAFINDGDRPTVGLVWPLGEAYKQGFREGDVIVKIDEKPLQSFNQFATWSFERGREYRFTVRNQRGFQREIKWVRVKAER